MKLAWTTLDQDQPHGKSGNKTFVFRFYQVPGHPFLKNRVSWQPSEWNSTAIIS